jgi:hypothetical protein
VEKIIVYIIFDCPSIFFNQKSVVCFPVRYSKREKTAIINEKFDLIYFNICLYACIKKMLQFTKSLKIFLDLFIFETDAGIPFYIGDMVIICHRNSV